MVIINFELTINQLINEVFVVEVIPHKKKLSGITALFANTIAKPASFSATKEVTFKLECNENNENIHFSDNSLSWWKMHRNVLPILAEFRQTFLRVKSP